jgi:hypothetical protein
MGYLTNYEIAAQTTDEKVLEDIKKLYDGLFKENSSVYAGRILAIGSDSVKWYEHEFDMMHLSIKHPTVKFVLEGVGQGDVWRKIFLGGKMKYLQPEIVWPDEDTVEWVQLEPASTVL